MLATETRDLQPRHIHAGTGAAATSESSPELSPLLSFLGLVRRAGGAVRVGGRGAGVSGMSRLGGWNHEGAGAGRQARAHGLAGGQEGWQSSCLGSCPSSLPLTPTSVCQLVL